MTPLLTSDAQAALSRRDFMKRSGALVVAFSAARLATDLGLAPDSVSAQGINGIGSPNLDSWVAVGADGRVTAYTGKCELGTGLYTAQMQLVAEELCVPMDRLTLIQCDTSMTPDQGTTSGAQSHPTNFNHANLALACATAREALVQMASRRLGVPVEQLTAVDGVVAVRGDASRRVAYGELIGGNRFNLQLNPKARRKPASQWTVLGTPVRRVDFPAMATGRFEYVHNVRVPGMLHGRVVRPPALGSTLLKIDEGSVQGMPGLVKVVVRKNFVGVVAEKSWQAEQAARRLKVEWSAGRQIADQRTFYQHLRSQTATRDSFTVDSGDVDKMLAGAATVVRSTYYHPYQMHASVGTACAMADVQGTRATIWSATQAVWPLRATMATLLGLKPEDVRIIFRMGSGCYGVNGADTVSYDAALLSQAVGRPVRVWLSRQDEMAWENYGPAFVIEQRVGLDPSGTIIAWDYEGWSLSLGGRPGYNQPGNVVTGYLAGFQPAGVMPRSPAPAPTGFDNGSNTAPSYVTGTVGGRSGGCGVVRSERALSHVIESPFFTGPLRSPARLQNTFAHECFMDEIAASLKADPVEYRLRHLRDPRLREVVSAGAAKAGWDGRPSPRNGGRRSGVATGRGMACVLYEGDNGYCAMVVEADVNQSTGLVTVKRCVAAMDCGPISNPDGLRNQMEGGIIHGISRALREEVTWSGEKVTSIDWRTYRPWFLGDQVPVIETVLINRPDAEAMGAGETTITVTAAAIGNAIFDATGARMRQLPFTPERVKAALDART
ncbi:MAG: xanthine dehydrogenase family protein molybdopterin-binding subunit [Acidobacteria bacterium]|nr:xanthine dehydrogenase family protein molybdopterin-binding subunit [Acidobacteriota bacterium]